jgi:hypothetical protein
VIAQESSGAVSYAYAPGKKIIPDTFNVKTLRHKNIIPMSGIISIPYKLRDFFASKTAEMAGLSPALIFIQRVKAPVPEIVFVAALWQKIPAKKIVSVPFIRFCV